jgi:hypothetical protein
LAIIINDNCGSDGKVVTSTTLGIVLILCFHNDNKDDKVLSVGCTIILSFSLWKYFPIIVLGNSFVAVDDSNLVGVVQKYDDDDAVLHPAPRDEDGATLPTTDRRSVDMIRLTRLRASMQFCTPANLSPRTKIKRALDTIPRSVKQKTLTMTA